MSVATTERSHRATSRDQPVFHAALPDHRRLRTFARELPLATFVAVATSLAVQLIVGMVRVPASSMVPLALGASGAAVLIGVLLVLADGYRRGWRPGTVTPLTWVTLSALGTLPLSVQLLGTKHYIFGISGDQSFRVQYLTRFTDSARLADIAYPDLPPYYPAGWFWIGGRIAALAGVEGWEAYKPYAIATMALSGVVAFCVWSLVVRRPPAVVLALITTVIGLRIMAYEPYLWILGAALPPLAVLALRLARAVTGCVSARRWAGSAVLLGFALGATGAIYSLLFWFLGMLLVVLGVTVVARTSRQGRITAARRLAVPAALIGAVALPLVLLVWAPYVAALVEQGFRSGAAQRFLPRSGALWPLPMVEPSLTGLVALVGALWIVVRARSNDVAQALGLVVLTVYGWYALSTLALAAGTTLLAFKLEAVLVAALACGAALGVLDAVRGARRRLGEASPVPIGAVAGVLSFAVVLGMLQTIPDEYEWSRSAEHGDYYPGGVTPAGTADDADAGAWNDELIATIDELTDVPPHDLVLLSANSQLLSYRPYFTFQTTIDQYANPLADFPARRALIEKWADTSTPAELLTALDASSVRAPSVFVLSRQPDGWHIGVTYDAFPDASNVRTGSVVFMPEVFDDPAFERRDVGPFVVVARVMAS